MTIEQAVLGKLRELPPDRQQEVLDFVESLQRDNAKRPRRSVEGLWADLSINISDADIEQARQEMWSNFPRDDV